MKKSLLVLIALTAVLLPFPSSARTAGLEGTAALAGGYNPVWGGYGGVDLRARASLNDYLSVAGDFEGLYSGIFAGGLSARPSACFGQGRLYLDTGVLYKRSDGIFDFVSHGSIGWESKHFDVSLGLFSRTVGSLSRDIHSTEEMIGEPFNVAYKVRYSLKGEDSGWDIWGGITDHTAYEFERHWSPIFYLGGRYALKDDLQLFCQTEVKPTGMFHLNACFYGVVCRMGVSFSF